jgi:hypothetical protein
MTTWHEDDTLEETLEFFWICSVADDGKSGDPVRIVLVIGSPRWANRVRHWSSDT